VAGFDQTALGPLPDSQVNVNVQPAQADIQLEFLEAPTVARYESRRHALIEGFRSLGWTPEPVRATMFLWLPVPAGFSAQDWTKHLIDKAGVVVTPGNAFGPGGNRFFRVSLIADPPVLAAAVERMREAGIRYEEQQSKSNH